MSWWGWSSKENAKSCMCVSCEELKIFMQCQRRLSFIYATKYLLTYPVKSTAQSRTSIGCDAFYFIFTYLNFNTTWYVVIYIHVIYWKKHARRQFFLEIPIFVSISRAFSNLKSRIYIAPRLELLPVLRAFFSVFREEIRKTNHSIRALMQTPIFVWKNQRLSCTDIRY